MTKKALSILVIACFYHFVLFAENVTAFSIPSNYLENGKVKLLASGSTSIKFTVSCLRYLIPGTTDLEPANISVTLVAYHPGSNGPVMVALGGPYTIKTADFNATGVTKTFDAVATYTDIKNETGIALLWSSNAVSRTLYNTVYQFISYTPPVPIANNTIAFNTPYEYIKNYDISGSTPVVATGNYTYTWLIDGGGVTDPTTYNVITNTVNSLQLAPSNWLVNGTRKIQRQITSSSGAVSLSNELILSIPSSGVELNMVELPGNTKVGDRFVPGTVVNLSIANAVPGVKYVWYYWHWFAPSNAAFKQLASGEGTPIIFTLSPTRFPPPPNPPARPDYILVWGSDGSKGTFYFTLN